MKKENSIINILVLIIIFIIVFSLLIFYQNYSKKQECYKESAKLWNSVNNDDYPEYMSSQEAYDRNNRQACASFSYIACVNGYAMNCSDTQKERISSSQLLKKGGK